MFQADETLFHQYFILIDMWRFILYVLENQNYLLVGLTMKLYNYVVGILKGRKLFYFQIGQAINLIHNWTLG